MPALPHDSSPTDQSIKRGWTIVLVACMLIAPGRHISAQSGSGKSKAKASAKAEVVPAGPTTLVGVYTDEQAQRGRDVYLGACKSCHSPESHTGATFAKWWRGKQLSDLFGFVKTKMPKNDPGSLDPYDAADVVAYLLKMNAMPVGKAELYPDVDSLKQYRIETKRSTATTTAKRTKP
jgi:hypothetical protein